MRSLYLLIFLLLGSLHLQGQDHYFVPEFHLGKIVPNYLNYPQSYPRIGLSYTYYYKGNDPNDAVQRYYKDPLLGVQLGYHWLGNPDLFGNQLDLVPVMNLPTAKGSFQFGLGVAYFNRTYQENPENKVIGSAFTWSFQSFYYRNFPLQNGRIFRLGIGYVHASNGHTQLPNYGMNSAVLTGSFVQKEAYDKTERTEVAQKPQNKWFLELKYGLGYHEFGGTTAPVGGPKKSVNGLSMTGAIQFKGQFKWRFGFGARSYTHYADSIASNPNLQAANVTPYALFFKTGIEYLIYHIGINVDAGINLHKPFFYHFADRYETVDNWQYFTKKHFLSRVGLRFYLFNTNKDPKHNFYIAPYLNANFGQADYTELAFGYVLKL